MGEGEKVLDKDEQLNVFEKSISEVTASFARKQMEALKEFVLLQGEVKTVVFDKENPHFKNKYASLTAITEEIRPLLAKHNFVITQKVYSRESRYYIGSSLVHSSGYSFDSGELELKLSGANMQSLGSAITYARRYQAAALLGIVSDEDNDGNDHTDSKIDQKQKDNSNKNQKADKVTPPPAPPSPKKSTGNNLVAPLMDLQKIVKKKNLDVDLVKRLIKVLYKKESSHHLDADELKDMAGLIEKYDSSSLSDFVLELERQGEVNA